MIGNANDPSSESDQEPEEIIEDLESLKSLLHEEDDSTPPEIPLLDEPVDNTLDEDPGLSEDTMQSLLDDTWKDSIESVLKEARETIGDNSTAWLPSDTDELNAALKIRIDTSVRQWLEEVLQANIGTLRKHIVRELSAELLTHLQQKFGADSASELTSDSTSNGPLILEPQNKDNPHHHG
ncbi:MAG: hypothetical protein AAF993_04805 [Pseudomonadota bacterium]